MKMKEVLISLLVDLAVFFLISNVLPETVPYATVIAIVAPTLFLVLVDSLRKYTSDD